MARYIGPKNKLSRREGLDLFGKGNKLRRREIPPGQHGQKRQRKTSDYGHELRAKQAIKRLYGVLEKQFRNYVYQAIKTRASSADTLISLLEQRLDNVVFRLSLAPTRPMARQLVTHGHILVNNKKVNLPAYQVKTGDTITLDTKALKIPHLTPFLEAKEVTIPAWLVRKGAVGLVKRQPAASDTLEPIDIQQVVEFYSR
jgi:small subunit ribosomal protein S4